MLSRDKNKITYLHFIMSVLVILIHSINNDTKFERFFSIDSGIGQFAVPLFFIISGFLFFRNIKSVDEAMYKVRKRVYTLLIPYLLWNLIYYTIHLFLKPGCGISINEIFNAAFTHKYNPSFWFVYQLILLSAISPFAFILLNTRLAAKRIPIFCIGILICIVAEVFIMLGIDIPYINEDAFIYYFFGLVMADLYNKGYLLFIRKKNILICIVLFTMAYIFNRYTYKLLLRNPIYYQLFTSTVVLVRLCGAMVLFYLFDLIFSYERVPKYMAQTFFLYAIHYMIVKAMIIMMKFVMYMFLPVGIVIGFCDLYTIVECITFVISPAVCVIINYHLSIFMMKKFGKQYSILVGNRK